jgi:hypothetical protein
VSRGRLDIYYAKFDIILSKLDHTPINFNKDGGLNGLNLNEPDRPVGFKGSRTRGFK